MNFLHVIRTVYNLGIFNNNKISDPAKWMIHRKQIFDNYCFKSMMKQTNKNIYWIILFDKITPVSEYGNNESFLRKVISSDNTMVEDFSNTINRILLINSEQIDCIITTRLDNDDVIRKDFIDKIQNHVKGLDKLENPIGINFPYGYLYNTKNKKKTMSAREESNPFISVVEPVRDNKYVQLFSGGHRVVAEQLNTIQIDDDRYWVRIIHEHNARNRMYGTKVNKIIGFEGIVQ